MLVAQERLANNNIHCFETAKGTWYAEIRSMSEGSTRPTAALSVKLQKPTRSLVSSFMSPRSRFHP